MKRGKKVRNEERKRRKHPLCGLMEMNRKKNRVKKNTGSRERKRRQRKRRQNKKKGKESKTMIYIKKLKKCSR